MNPVEHLYYNSMEYEYMQLFTTYNLGEMYKLSWNEWWDQTFAAIEFQLNIGRKIYELKKSTIDEEEKGVDEKKIEEELMRQAQYNSFPGNFKR